MATLINGEFEFDGVTFGTQRSGYPLMPGGYTVGAPQFRVQDVENPMGDGRIYGSDYLGGVTHTWQVYALDEGVNAWGAVVQSASALRAVWHDQKHRINPWRVSSLRVFHGDRVYRIYGRPRNFAVDRSLARKGVVGLTFDFAAVDDLAYSDVEQSHTLGLVIQSGGGLVAPLKAPLTGSGTSLSRAGQFVVGGDVATLPRIRFQGPSTNPRLDIGNLYSANYTGTLNSDQYVIIDAQPWARTVLRNGSASVAGLLSSDTPSMPEMRIPPGTHVMSYSAVDPSQTSSATLYWRDAVRAI